jgi:sugar O-acyltransferase (sialic acid O-acetyltransferase NeuD family)
MKTKKLVIYGTGSFAEYAAFLFQNDSNYEVIGFCMEQSYLSKIKSNKQQITSFENLGKNYSMEHIYIFIAVGNNLIRERIFNKAKFKGYQFASYISSKAIIWEDLIIGHNSFIGEGSVIQPFVEIKKNTIILNSVIGHHCKLGNNVFLSVCTLGGNVKVGDTSYIGMGSNIKQNVNIAERNIIGMGSIIVESTKPNTVYTTKSANKRSLSFEQVSDLFLK